MKCCTLFEFYFYFRNCWLHWIYRQQLIWQCIHYCIRNRFMTSCRIFFNFKNFFPLFKKWSLNVVHSYLLIKHINRMIIKHIAVMYRVAISFLHIKHVSKILNQYWCYALQVCWIESVFIIRILQGDNGHYIRLDPFTVETGKFMKKSESLHSRCF